MSRGRLAVVVPCVLLALVLVSHSRASDLRSVLAVEASVSVEAGQRAVARDLKDPESAQFRDVRLMGETVCGEVNAKNSFGAFVGFRPFFATPRKDGGIVAEVSQDAVSPKDADWCIASALSKRRDNPFFKDYEGHHCSEFDASFHLLHSALCPAETDIGSRDAIAVRPEEDHSTPPASRIECTSDQQSTIDPSITISRKAYNRIQEGMTYAQAKVIFGEPGRETVRSTLGGICTVEYSWKNQDGSNALLMFQNDRLIMRAQSGLP